MKKNWKEMIMCLTVLATKHIDNLQNKQPL